MPTRPTDPLYNSQWHFAMLGDIETIWDDYTGRGVNVGVYDDGIDYNHEDLSVNYDPSLHVRDANGNPIDPTPSQAADAHGTACAGLIGSANNGRGGVGVAFGTTLTSVNIFGSVYGNVNGPVAEFLHVVRQATNFDVMSNSWGAAPRFTAGLNDGGFADQVDAVYGTLSAIGRGGLGTVIVQAAGNDTLDGGGAGINASRFTITVAAVEQNGTSSDYSNFGASILVAGPAAGVTTDPTGAAGSNPGAYRDNFNGTSAATPVVTGVVTLMLEANPDLGWRDVQNILANSASYIGDGNYSFIGTNEDGTWYDNASNTFNGGGNHVHTNYGYGMVNAYNAVRMAEVWHLFGNAQVSRNERTASSGLNNFPDVIVPSDFHFTTTFTISENIEIEHVALSLGFQSDFVGDLNLALISAGGTQVQVYLGDSFGNGEGTFDGNWTFGIDGLRGELSAGTWTLGMYDQFGFFAPIVARSASLTVYGAAASADDVHHITDEYLLMGTLDTSRRTLNDTNGGKDWINMAAIAGDVVLDLAGGSVFRVNGQAWGSLANGAQFENVVAGDGDDVLIGTAAANALHGMRGNDRLNGGGGADTLDGGQGTDTLKGGSGNDTYIIRSAAARVIEAAPDGTADVLRAAVSYALAAGVAIETMTTTNNAQRTPINLAGNAFAQRIFGNAGVNTLNDGGGAGADTLNGLGGNDTYVVNNAGSRIVEIAGGGTADVLRAGVSFTLSADNNIEVMTTTNTAATTAISLTGNAGVQSIMGNAGANTLNDGGGVGADRLTGLRGNDTYVVNNSRTVIIEAAGGGADTLRTGVSFVLAADDSIEVMTTTNAAGRGAINLTGNGLGQRITGNSGANRIDGAGGPDTLTGGGGADTFVFRSGLGTGNVDIITDFNRAADTIELENAIFTGLARGVLVGAAFMANAAGLAITQFQRIIYETDNGNLWFDADGNGSGARIRFADLAGGLGLTNADFFVV